MIALSIIVPVYKTETYLKKCIDSLLKQDLAEYEILLVNDGSPDQSQKIIDEYEKKYPIKIRSFLKENGGLGDARNFAIPYAKGKYLMFVDSDDAIKENCLQEIYDTMENQKLDILVFDFVKVYDDGKLVHEQSMPEVNDKEYILSTPNACNKAFKTELFKENHLFFPTRIWYEDFALIPGLVRYSKKIGYINKGFYFYQIHDSSIMNQIKYNPKFLDMIEAVDQLRVYLEPEYHAEMEYLSLQHQYYGSALKLLPFKKYDVLEKCLIDYEHKYPLWEQNKYFKKKPNLYQVFCLSLKKRNFYLARILLFLRCKIMKRG